ncbi:MAG: hypothetical protein H8E57_01270, partial [Candidatus Cloacimonetes bacterium]|nr:hypothetical protein [Candidatus Cloacimonadota bacterium]
MDRVVPKVAGGEAPELMFNFADVLDSGRDIHWRSGSNSNITNGIINLDLVWFFHDGTNAQLGSNNEVHFDGSSMQEIYCWDEDAEFNDVFIDNTTMTVWFHSSGVDTIHVAGDMTITAGNDFYLRTCDLLVDGTLEIEDTATLYVNEIEGVGGSITNNSDFTLNGELNIDVEDAFIGGDVFINGDFSIAVTGLLAIDSGSFTIDNPVVGWESIWGTINMSDGLYFSNQGPSFQSTANTDISGGLIDVDHLSALNIGNFEPTGGTVEISHDDHYYGNISCSNGNYFHNLTISGFVDLDGGFLNTDIIVQNDLEIESGQLWFRGNEATVLNDVIISGGLKMLDPLDVLNAGDGSGDEIIWNAGSFSDQTSDGAINVYGNWTFEDGTDAQIGTGNTVNFVGGNNQLISCFDADADFGNVNCDQTAMSTWLHSSSTQPMRVSGDMTITAQSFHIQSEELIVDGTLDIQDGTLMDLGFSGSLTNNSDFVLNGELDVDAGDALIHGEFELAETGILTIDGGSFVSDAAYSRAWQPFNGTLNLSDGLLEITNNSVIIGIPFVDNITGGIFRIGASFSSTVLDAFQPAGGSLEMTTDQFSRYINCTNGSYLYDLIINTTETIAITADLIIQNNLEINSGGLYSNDLGISVGGDWTNNVGDDGFLEENGTVTFFGAGESDITTDETFYNLILDKTNPQFYALEIMDDITVNVLNDFDITDATLEMNNGSTLDIDNDLNISLDAGLNAFGEPGLNIFVGGDWNDDNDHHDSWIGFYYGTSTVTFDGDEDQILTSACAADSFYHVIIDKPAGHFRASNDTRIFGNLRIADGGWFDDENYLVHYLYGDFTVAAGAAWFGTTSNAVVFSGTADQEVSFDPPTTDGYFHDVYVDKTEETRRNSAPTGEELLFRQSRANRDDLRSDTVTLITDCSALGNGNLTLHEGILDLNGNDYLCTGNVSINNGGRLVLDDNSSLKVGNGYDLNVNDGGIFEII